MQDPLKKLDDWWQKAKLNSPLNQKNALCLSTIDEHGFPNSRFVDLKSIEPNGLTFCCCYDSPKGKNIKNNPRVSLTMWWDHVGYQIRMQGIATEADENLSSLFWASRTTGAKIATHGLYQSEEIDSALAITEKCQQSEQLFQNKSIPRPDNWGAYIVEPRSIEFLQFKQNRNHIRELYTQDQSSWRKVLLQP